MTVPDAADEPMFRMLKAVPLEDGQPFAQRISTLGCPVLMLYRAKGVYPDMESIPNMEPVIFKAAPPARSL